MLNTYYHFYWHQLRCYMIYCQKTRVTLGGLEEDSPLESILLDPFLRRRVTSYIQDSSVCLAVCPVQENILSLRPIGVFHIWPPYKSLSYRRKLLELLPHYCNPSTWETGEKRRGREIKRHRDIER